MQRKIKELTKLLKWIEEHRGFWQIICNENGEECSIKVFQTVYNKLIEDSLYYLVPVLFTTHQVERYIESVKESCVLNTIIRDIKSGNLDKIINNIDESLE